MVDSALVSRTEHMAAEQPGRSREKPGDLTADRGFACCIPMETAMEVSTFEVLKELLPTGAPKPADVNCRRHPGLEFVRLRVFYFHDLRLS